MARRRVDDAIKKRMWKALLLAAMEHHKTHKEHGMITVIAGDAGVSKASVSEWKTGKSYPEDQTLRDLASLYRVSAESLSGYSDDSERYPPPDEVLGKAAAITQGIVEELLENGTSEQFLAIMNRCHELILEGRSDSEIHGILFEEARRMKREG